MGYSDKSKRSRPYPASGKVVSSAVEGRERGFTAVEDSP